MVPLEGNELPAILQDINWLDVLFVILLLGMVYKGSGVGVGGQILSLIGWFALIFVPIRYYSLLSEAIFGFLLQRWAKPLSFLLIVIVIFTIIKVLERISSIVSGEELALIERAGGVLVATLRAITLFGIIGMQLLLVPIDSVHLWVTQDSKTCMFFVNLDANVYSWMTGIIGKPEKKREKDEIVREFLESTNKAYN